MKSVTQWSLVLYNLNHGKLKRLEAASRELIESQYLSKYKNDFSSFLGKQACHVALVTSGQSKAIHDVEEVFKRRPGIVKSIHRVRLNNSKSIASGIFEASESTADVIMIVRGGARILTFLSLILLKSSKKSIIPQFPLLLV